MFLPGGRGALRGEGLVWLVEEGVVFLLCVVFLTWRGHEAYWMLVRGTWIDRGAL